MKTFKDNAGRTWTISINVASAKRVKVRTGVNLYDLVDNRFEGYANLVGNLELLVDVIYVLCEEEASKAGVTDEGFGQAMGGDALGNAKEAFEQEFIDFFPNAQIREALRKLMETGRQVTDLMVSRVVAELDGTNPEDVVARLSVTSGNSPGSSASIPDHSPGESSTSWPKVVRGGPGSTRRKSSH